jgi:hypothetical protein
VHIGQLLGALVWPVSALLAALAARDMLHRHAADLGDRLERERRQAVDEGFRRGQRLVVDLTAAAASDARAGYLHARDRLPPDVAAEVERRLADVHARLTRLAADCGPAHRQPSHRQPSHRQPSHRRPSHRRPGSG